MVRSLLLGAVCTVNAHMQLFNPAPLRAANNPHTIGSPDDELLFPYNCCGKVTPMPCRGYLSLLGTPEGAPVVSWMTGSNQTWSLIGPPPYGGNHYGGSCQIGFSIDGGNTFRVVISYEGNCPHRNGGEDPTGQQFPFKVPHDLPNGEALFAWTWSNREQEFFMNCAVVNITRGLEKNSSNPVLPHTRYHTSKGYASSLSVTRQYKTMYTSGPKCSSINQSNNNDEHLRVEYSDNYDKNMKKKRFSVSDSMRLVPRSSLVPFSRRPLMFLPDNGCSVPMTTAELKYPSPGPEVVEGDGEYQLQLPVGGCS